MFLFCIPVSADNRSARIRIPIRCPHAGKCRNNINTIGIGTLFAYSSDCPAVRIIRIPSLSHWMAAPATKTLPSSAYSTSPEVLAAMVVSSPCLEMIGSLSGMHQKKNNRFHRYFLHPLFSKQHCPNNAACWSPATPITGIFTAKNLLLCLSEETTRRPHFRQHFFLECETALISLPPSSICVCQTTWFLPHSYNP